MLDLRIAKIYENTEKLKTLIDEINKNPGCCDEVWLYSAYGFPTLEKHRETVERLKVMKKQFEENGVDVSLQISNTLGHSNYHTLTLDYSGLVYLGDKTERMVDADGTVANGSFCIFGKNYREYIKKSTQMYAELKPKCVWVDDDLRAIGHSPVTHCCFCDDCIKRFNDKYNTAFTREELVREINYGDVIWRERYIEQMKEGFYGLTKIITEAIIEGSPDTQMGYQYGRFFNYLGNDYRYILDAMYDVSKKAIKTRPGAGFYHDKQPMGMLQKALELNCANSVLPEYVTHACPEIESTPDVFFGKSLEGNCKEASLNLAYGCNGLTFAALNSGSETDEYNKGLLKWFTKYRPYWDKLIEHNEGTKTGGAAIYTSDNSYKRVLKEGEEPFKWKDIVGFNRYDIMKIGMPLSHEKDSASVIVLYPDMVDCMNDDDIRELLKKPVITDAESVMKMIERGFKDSFGASFEPIEAISAREHFTNHPINEGFCGMSWKASVYASSSICVATRICDKDSKTESLGEYIDLFTGKSYGNINAIVNTYCENGEPLSRWAVFGYSLWEDILSSAKRNQILSAADYICNNTMPARLISPEQVAVVPRINKKGNTTCVTLLSITIGTTDEMELIIRNPEKEEFTLINPYRNQKLEFTKNGNDYIVKIPAINPWEIVTVFC